MNEKNRNEKIKEHFNEEAGSFDPWISALAPYYAEFIDAMVSALYFEPDRKIRVADLGCGTGSVTMAVKNRFPASEIVCVDLSDKMLDEARAKLASYSGIEFHEADITRFDPDEGYDAVLSSLCLHHIEDPEEKDSFFRGVFEALHPGGIFVIYDVVLASDERIQKIYIDKWRKFMQERIPPEEVDRVLELYKEEDRPFSMIDEMKRLERAGFDKIDIICKHYNGAVYAGIK